MSWIWVGTSSGCGNEAAAAAAAASVSTRLEKPRSPNEKSFTSSMKVHFHDCFNRRARSSLLSNYNFSTDGPHSSLRLTTSIEFQTSQRIFPFKRSNRHLIFYCYTIAMSLKHRLLYILSIFLAGSTARNTHTHSEMVW